MYDLALAIFAALAFCPLFFFPTCVCCGQTCGNCAGSTTPQQVQIDITGMANDSCTDCANLDGTWILDIGANCTGASDGCKWHYDLSVNMCGGTGACMFAQVDPVLFSSNFTLLVGIYRLTTRVAFQKTYTGTKPTCSSWSAENVPFSFNSAGECDGSGATCTATAL